MPATRSITRQARQAGTHQHQALTNHRVSCSGSGSSSSSSAQRRVVHTANGFPMKDKMSGYIWQGRYPNARNFVSVPNPAGGRPLWAPDFLWITPWRTDRSPPRQLKDRTLASIMVATAPKFRRILERRDEAKAAMGNKKRGRQARYRLRVAGLDGPLMGAQSLVQQQGQ